MTAARRERFAKLAFLAATGARVELTTGKRRERTTAARLGTLIEATRPEVPPNEESP